MTAGWGIGKLLCLHRGRLNLREARVPLSPRGECYGIASSALVRSPREIRLRALSEKGAFCSP